ncbi:D-aminoacyl-tRNA deacylase [Anaerosacchariphilus polymeriproducens]|uniref:D-aminoacyl-tRNA deacylase n=1 Tax=Anaerosacchariphilus polymeriproducens TaxID=1812858 RepID=A0A371AU02_9FIRM|nr:D-aminoacyl-tRNA deacylase [Anaerosacchariphilus polymeriproducens]RDU23047.1 D-tyrosyl-tRNA(Tyr) deacylase [Anaerosacchariphilus polymeriproducens]
MKFVIQRVNRAEVSVENKIIGKIQKGLLVFIGISNHDTKEIADKMLRKLIQLRIFEDNNGKTNLSIEDIDGHLLLVSQFTLYANCKKGNRPSFIDAGSPSLASELYNYLIEKAMIQIPYVGTGEFGADMKINLENDGPFTIILDSHEICLHK